MAPGTGSNATYDPIFDFCIRRGPKSSTGIGTVFSVADLTRYQFDDAGPAAASAFCLSVSSIPIFSSVTAFRVPVTFRPFAF